MMSRSERPTGWGLREVKGGWQYLSPDGVAHLGKEAALKYMIINKYPEEKIEEMRNLCQYEGWFSDPGLPRDWLYRAGAGAQVSLLSSAGTSSGPRRHTYLP